MAKEIENVQDCLSRMPYNRKVDIFLQQQFPVSSTLGKIK